MNNLQVRTEQIMKALSELSRDAGQAEKLPLMYAANRAWRELDKSNRSALKIADRNNGETK